MVDLDGLLWELEERQLATALAKHDEARACFTLWSNTALDKQEYLKIVADYWNHHWTYVMEGAEPIDEFRAMVEGRKLLEAHCARVGRTVDELVLDAIEGTNGGVRASLDIMANEFKSDLRRLRIHGLFDKYINPIGFEEKTEAVRELFCRCFSFLPPSVDPFEPEAYAVYYKELILAYVQSEEALRAMLERG